MTNLYKVICSTIIACFIGIPEITFGQDSRYFDRSQMSSSMLNSIAQDRQGYLWMGSNYGLMRFDGNTFKTWLHADNNSNTIVDNRILKVIVGRDNRVHIATANGLQTYNQVQHTFTLAKLADKDFNGYISDVCELHDGTILCVASGVGVYKMSAEKGTDKSTRKGAGNAGEGARMEALPGLGKLSWLNQLNKAAECADGSILISGQRGDIAVLKNGKVTERKLCNAPIIDLEKDLNGDIIIVSNDRIWRYQSRTGKFVELTYPTLRANGNGSNSGNISYSVAMVAGNVSPMYVSAYCGKSGNIYLATSGNGVKVIANGSNTISDYNKVKSTVVNVSKAKLNVIYEDKDENLWLGCTNQGLLMAPSKPSEFRFKNVNSIIGENAAYIQDLAYDKGGNLWCTIEDYGAYEISAGGEMLQHVATNLQLNRLHTNVAGEIIAGVNNKGVYTIQPNGTLKLVAAIDGTFNITALASDKHGNIYAGIDGRGVAIIDANSHDISWLYATEENEMINSWIPALCVDNQDRLWIGHYSGISCYNLKTRKFIKVANDDGLRQGVCNAIAAGKDGAIWAATSHGLVRYDAATRKVERYTYNNGLGDNSFLDLVLDANGNIWASTRNGMNKFNIAEKKFTAYYGGNGMEDNLYNRVAATAKADRISFSGQNGITAFDAAKIKGTKLDKAPIITDITIKGLSLEQAMLDNSGLIKVSDDDLLQSINLDYSDNVLSLALSTLDFRNAKNVSYEYKLNKGEWISTNVGEDKIYINNLSPGSYKLQIRACENGVYSPVKEIAVNIGAPWFLTPLAKIIYAALFLGICMLIYLVMRRKRDNQINEAKLQFFINISHEIRSPMTLILSPLEALLKEQYDEKTMKRLHTIHRNATRILGLVNQLLDVRKIDKGKMNIHCSKTEMVGFINEFIEMFKPKAEAKNISLSFESEVESLDLWIDRNNFDKVLVNLLSNAFKYTPKGGEIAIELSQSDDNRAMIRVLDTGTGIDEKKTKKIFERFYQDNAKAQSGESVGFGIGLNLCKLMVELHHGTIKAYNRVDAQGSCFEVKIPLGDSHLSRQEKEQVEKERPRAIVEAAINAGEKQQPVKSVRHRSTNRILVVDDDSEIRDYLTDYFAAYYKVETVSDGEAAWKYILEHGADLVISDVNMPVMNGIQLLKNIKNNGNTNHIPVILLTSQTEGKDRKEGWEKGADAYVAKPFSGEELRAITDSLIENRIMLKGRFSGAQSQEDKIDKIEAKSNDDVLMNKIVEMINAHIDDPNLNVEMLGHEVGISRAHLHRKMKDMIGVSPSDFIRTIRLRKACELLKNTDNDVTQIAYNIGFTSQTHFSTAFKKFTGVSPSEYRNK